MKRCTKCGEEKGLGEFGQDKRARDGRKSECRACARLRDRAYSKTPRGRQNAVKRAQRYRQRHRERVLANQRAGYARHREKRLEEMATWRAENRATHRNAVRRWAQANPKRKLELQKQYAERHPERVLANARRQEMRRRGEGENPTAETVEYMLILRADPCGLCGQPTEHVDHIEPRRCWNLKVPGWNQWENLSGACQHCNCRKAQIGLLHYLLKNPLGI